MREGVRETMLPSPAVGGGATRPNEQPDRPSPLH